ncbi:MAG: aminotransferase class IV [Cytophagales bacterium]
MHQKIIYNHQLIIDNELNISLQNRAFNYGDALFESILVINHKIYFLKDHYERLILGCEYLKINTENLPNLEFLQQEIHILLQSNNLKDARVKINIWRKDGGLFTPQDNHLEYCIRAQSYSKSPKISKKLINSPYKINEKSGFTFVKSANSLTYILSMIYAQEMHTNDCILLNSQNQIVECCSSNIFFEKDGIFYTPDLQSGCLPGIMRKNLIQLLHKKKIEVKEEKIMYEDFSNFDHCFSTNVMGISQISQINEKCYPNFKIVEQFENELYRSQS